MATYRIDLTLSLTFNVEVEADDKAEAEALAMVAYEQGAVAEDEMTFNGVSIDYVTEVVSE